MGELLDHSDGKLTEGERGKKIQLERSLYQSKDAKG